MYSPTIGLDAGEVETDVAAVAAQQAGAAVVQRDFEGFLSDEVSLTEYQLGTGRAVLAEVKGDLRLDHLSLAREHLRHVGASA